MRKKDSVTVLMRITRHLVTVRVPGRLWSPLLACWRQSVCAHQHLIEVPHRPRLDQLRWFRLGANWRLHGRHLPRGWSRDAGDDPGRTSATGEAS